MKKRPAASRWFTPPVWWTGTSHSSKGTYGLLVHFVEQNLWWQSIKCAVFDKLYILNHIYIFCACALPKKDSHMDDKTPLRHIYIIQHIPSYNCHLATTCRNTSKHVMNILLMVMSAPLELKTIDLLFLGVKSIVLSGHVCDIRLCDWLPGMVASYTTKGYPWS